MRRLAYLLAFWPTFAFGQIQLNLPTTPQPFNRQIVLSLTPSKIEAPHVINWTVKERPDCCMTRANHVHTVDSIADYLWVDSSGMTAVVPTGGESTTLDVTVFVVTQTPEGLTNQKLTGSVRIDNPVIPGPVPPPVPPPTPPPDPVPPPNPQPTLTDGKFGLAKFVADLTKDLPKSECLALVESYRTTAADVKAGKLATPQLVVNANQARNAAALDKFASRTDWIDKFFEPVRQKLNLMLVITNGTADQAIQYEEIALGLEHSGRRP